MERTPGNDLIARAESKWTKLYAQFGRRKGGLLLIVQAAAMLAEFAVARLLPPQPQWWHPVVVMPFYLGYFIVREPLFVRLYRPYGHLEENEARSDARSALWIALIIPLIVSLGPRMQMQVHYAVWLAWELLLWAVLAVRGRMPVDGGISASTAALVALMLRSGTRQTLEVLLWCHAAIACIYLAIGIFEHRSFARAVGRGV